MKPAAPAAPEVVFPLHPKQGRALRSRATEILYGGAAGPGKALCLNTLLATPTGWTTMGDVAPGDTLFDERGEPCRVLGATEVMEGRPCYRVTFSDGAKIVADAEHQWPTLEGQAVALETTLDLAARLRDGSVPRIIGTPWLPRRFVIAVEPVPSVPVRCIEVDSPSHCYLAGREMVPTHNSHFLRVASIVWSLAIPGLQTYLFRRSLVDLQHNHMSGPTSYEVMLRPWLELGYVNINQNDNVIKFRLPGLPESRIHLCYADNFESVKKRFQGPEIHVLLIDEMTQIPDPWYRFLRSRVRMTGIRVPREYEGCFPRIVGATNPGSIAHNEVKAAFIKGKGVPEPFTIWRTPPEEGGMLRQFIPAVLADNPSLMESDPGYLARLQGLGTAELVRAMVHGDWDIVAGGALSDCWTIETEHRIVLPPFQIPWNWKMDRSFDWGDSKPFSVAWWAESNGEEVQLQSGQKLFLPRGSLVNFAEWYGWSGKPNEGLRMLSSEIGRTVVEKEKQMGIFGRVVPGPADPSIFNWKDAKSTASEMALHGCSWTAANNGPGSRVAGFQDVRKMLKAAVSAKADPEQPWQWQEPLQFVPRTAPGLFFFSTCRDGAIRTWPTLPLSPSGDDVDTNAEDHCVVGETMVATEDGPRRIDSLAGQTGRALGPDGRFHRFSRVRKTRARAAVWRLTLEDGRSIVATPDHLVLTASGWRELQNLEPGDRLVSVWYGRSLPSGVRAVEEVGHADAWNMEVEGVEAFAVEGGIVVHNCYDAGRYRVHGGGGGSGVVGLPFRR